jgi:chromosomal replication initiator protein
VGKKTVLSDMWSKFLDLVRAEVGSRVVDTWFCALSLFRWDQRENTVYLQAPNAFIQDWVQKKYTTLFKTHLGRLLNAHDLIIVFVPLNQVHKSTLVHEATNAQPQDSSDASLQSIPQETAIVQARTLRKSTTALKSPLVQINPHYSFDAFVVGPSNSLAYAAAQAVSDNPGHAYNPLFVSGGSGLGKTHLLQAIGNMIRHKHQNVSILYQTADRFVNDFINAIRFDHVQKFKTRYQGVDVLLMDDVQFMSHKEQSQDAFFHIFNSLYESRKQIVVSGDMYPQEMQGVPERLRSRFGCGLITDLYAPTLETKIDILQKKAALTLHEPLHSDVIHFIASQTSANIRQLEGAFVRVMAFAALTKQEVTLDLAHRVLLSESNATIKSSLDPLILTKIIAKSYGYTLDDLRSKSRNKELAQARHVAMFMIKKYTNYSLRDIGAFLGNRDHSTIMHGIDRVEELLLSSTPLKQRIATIEQEIS